MASLVSAVVCWLLLNDLKQAFALDLETTNVAKEPQVCDENENVLPQILRDSGSVDQNPQRWTTLPGWPNKDAVFGIDLVDQEADSLYRSGILQLLDMNFTWRTDGGTCSISDETGTCLSQKPNGEELAGIDGPDDWMACDEYTKTPYAYVHNFQTLFQSIDIFHGKEEDDACLYLDGYLHMCASSRPHYHEVFVHYAARFIDQVRRVIFIGGGDSMVLHEVLKYPSLELVVGLELDQDITKATFMNFGTQPHWDNPKVQWYYGDAAESMTILPSDYYGSFDLVIVDILTEVAEDLEVNDELNLMEAAMLLMKPDGIIVKNEDQGYVPGSKSIDTKYSLDLAFHDVPLYCLQVFVLGSNTVDFLTTTPKDHGVETLYLKDIDSFQFQFDSWYNFGVDGGGNSSFCRVQDKRNVTESVAGTQALGILMILEAEHTKATLESADAVQPFITQALNVTGLFVTGVSSSLLSYAGLEGFMLVVNVIEGLITVRCIPLLRYCAFDIQLYGSGIQKLDLVKLQLLDAVQSKYSSSYRFVTAGVSFEQHQELVQIGPPSGKNVCHTMTDGVAQSPEKIRKERRAEDFDPPQAAKLHSYDHRDALAQWQSQKPIGSQAVTEIASQSPLDIDSAANILKETANRILALAHNADAMGTRVEVSNIGEGLVIVATCVGGSVVATFDGSDLLTFNFFTLATDILPHDIFEEHWDKLFNADDWTESTFVEFPRGTGSVVIFKDDLDGEQPIWA